MKHMQTLAIIMMTVAMVFAAPHSPSYRAKRTPGNCSDTNLQKKEIHAEAASLLEKLKPNELNEFVPKPMNGSDFCMRDDKNEVFFCKLARILHGESDNFSRMRRMLAAYNKNGTHCVLDRTTRYRLKDLLNNTLSCSKTQC